MSTRPMIVIIGIAMLFFHFVNSQIPFKDDLNWCLTDDVHYKEPIPLLCKKENQICFRTFSVEKDGSNHTAGGCTENFLPKLVDHCTPKLFYDSTDIDYGTKERKIVRLCVCEEKKCNTVDMINLPVVEINKEELNRLQKFGHKDGKYIQINLAEPGLSCLSTKDPNVPGVEKYCDPGKACMRIFAQMEGHDFQQPDCDEIGLLQKMVDHCTPRLIYNITKDMSQIKTVTMCFCKTDVCNTEGIRKLPVAEMTTDDLKTLEKAFAADANNKGAAVHIELAPKVDNAQEEEKHDSSATTIYLRNNVLAIYFCYLSI